MITAHAHQPILRAEPTVAIVRQAREECENALHAARVSHVAETINVGGDPAGIYCRTDPDGTITILISVERSRGIVGRAR